MTPSSRAEAEVKAAAQRAVSSATRARQKSAELALLYLEDYDAMVADLNETYKALHRNQDKWLKRPKVCFKLLEPIVDAMCGLYRECPAYTFEEKDRAWADMFAEWKDEHWSTMSDVDRFTLTSGVTGVRPMVDGPGAPLELALYTGDQLDYDPLPSKPTKIARLVLSFRTSLEQDMGLVEQLWTPATYERLVNGVPKFTAAEQLAFPGGVNPYGRIPHVLFHNSKPRWSLMGEPITDLVAVSRAINRQMSDHHYRMILSGSILYTKGEVDEQIKVGPDAHVKLAENGEAGFLEADAQVASLVESINLYLRMFFMSRRIPESAIAAVQSGESGIKIVADQTALGDYRKDRASLFGPWERELIRMELFAKAYHDGKRPRWEDVPAPSVAYQLPQEPMSLERRSDWDRAIRLGLATAVDEMVARNPSMDRPTALKKIEENLAETLQLQGGRPIPSFTSGQRTSVKLTAEETIAEEEEEADANR